MLSGNCKKCGKQSLRLSDGLCFRCKFIQNREDYIRRTAMNNMVQKVVETLIETTNELTDKKDIPPNLPMETAVIVDPGKTEPPKKKKRAPRKKKKE